MITERHVINALIILNHSRSFITGIHSQGAQSSAIPHLSSFTRASRIPPLVDSSKHQGPGVAIILGVKQLMRISWENWKSLKPCLGPCNSWLQPRSTIVPRRKPERNKGTSGSSSDIATVVEQEPKSTCECSRFRLWDSGSGPSPIPQNYSKNVHTPKNPPR